MKFKYQFENFDSNKLLSYIEEEHSFFMYPPALKTDLEIAVNTITLSIFEKKVVFLSGFCGINYSKTLKVLPPISRKGVLSIEGNFKPGFAYSAVENLPVSTTLDRKWVCIGNPHETNMAVEFLPDSIAVIKNSKLKALWLRKISRTFDQATPTKQPIPDSSLI
jgi:hypothetical protein